MGEFLFCDRCDGFINVVDDDAGGGKDIRIRIALG
jgi:hypothetical protein